jgi:hypothetical protein
MMNDEMKPYITRTLKIAILPESESIFSERCTTIEIEDQSGGEYLVVTQNSMSSAVKEQQIEIDSEEWTPLKEAIDRMFVEIIKHKEP